MGFPLLGDVKGQLKTTDDLTGFFQLRNERRAQQLPAPSLRCSFIFKSHPFTAKGLFDERLYPRVGFDSEKRPGTDLFGSVRIDAKPVLVPAVDVAIHQGGVKVGHERWNGVGDQSHLGFAALQRLTKLTFQAQCFSQLIVGTHQLARALSHSRFEQRVLLANQVFRLPLLRDVRVERDETVPGNGHAADVQHCAVGPGAFDVVGLERFCRLHPLTHIAFDIAIAVLAPFGVVAHEILEG